MRVVLSLGVLVVLSGCNAALRTVPLADPVRANHQLAGRSVTVVLATGETAPAQAVRVARDSTSWFDPATGALVSVPTASVAEVRHRDRWRTVLRGARRGALGGAIVGGVLGTLVGLGAGDVLPGNQTQDTILGAVGGVGYGGMYGAAAGLVVGALSSPTDRYVVQPASSPPVGTSASEPRAVVRRAPGPPVAPAR